MKPLFVLLLAAAGAGAQTDRMTRELDEAARVASVMVDGDVCKQITTARALGYMFHVDPKDPWVAGDNYDVNHEAFNSVKKTLMRIARLVSFPADANLWMPIPGHPDKIHVVVRNVNELSQFWTWGALSQNLFPEMKTVLETGRRVTVTKKPGWISVLAPVYDSLGDVAGLVEVATQQKPDAHENVK